MRKKKLRSGYTTGACAAAAAKAAVELLLSGEAGKTESVQDKETLRAYERADLPANEVEIPFPDGSRVKFRIQGSGVPAGQAGIGGQEIAWAAVVKDAGDDPDVTHGAEIVAEAKVARKRESVKASVGAIHELPLQIIIKGGEGVGTVTKPGLAVPVGEPAINPVPRRMIEQAVREALSAEARKRESVKERSSRLRSCDLANVRSLEITISVPRGEGLAKKTLNHRLGIIGGISILGTTGIVKPVSADAWTATIMSSMDVAKASGLTEIVLSAGRSSERSHMEMYKLPEESYVLMGDYLEYSLVEAVKHGFQKVHLCAQWAKMLKIAMATPQTHVRFGAIDIQKAVEFLNVLGIPVPHEKSYNTAREIFDWLLLNPNVGTRHAEPLKTVCSSAKSYAETVTGGMPVVCYLVSYQREIVATSE